jgi:hypothetical protein
MSSSRPKPNSVGNGHEASTLAMDGFEYIDLFYEYGKGTNDDIKRNDIRLNLLQTKTTSEFGELQELNKKFFEEAHQDVIRQSYTGTYYYESQVTRIPTVLGKFDKKVCFDKNITNPFTQGAAARLKMFYRFIQGEDNEQQCRKIKDVNFYNYERNHFGHTKELRIPDDDRNMRIYIKPANITNVFKNKAVLSTFLNVNNTESIKYIKTLALVDYDCNPVDKQADIRQQQRHTTATTATTYPPWQRMDANGTPFYVDPNGFWMYLPNEKILVNRFNTQQTFGLTAAINEPFTTNSIIKSFKWNEKIGQNGKIYWEDETGTLILSDGILISKILISKIKGGRMRTKRRRRPKRSRRRKTLAKWRLQ